MSAVALIDPAVCCACSQAAFGRALDGWRLVYRPDAQETCFALCPACFGRLMPRLGPWLHDRRLLEQPAERGRPLRERLVSTL
jgi:hypothetical protein